MTSNSSHGNDTHQATYPGRKTKKTTILRMHASSHLHVVIGVSGVETTLGARQSDVDISLATASKL